MDVPRLTVDDIEIELTPLPDSRLPRRIEVKGPRPEPIDLGDGGRRDGGEEPRRELAGAAA